MTSESTASTPAESAKRLKFLGRIIPGIPSWILIAICAAGIAFVQNKKAEGDAALANILTLVLSFGIFMTCLGWFVVRSAYPALVRLLLVVSLILGVALWFVFFEIDHVDGNLMPHWKRRGAKAPDELLQAAATVAVEVDQGVDLATTTPNDFPQFLGPNRDLNVTSVRLARDWAARPPRQVWRQPIGAGWSAFAVVNGFAVTMEQRGEEELVSCYEVETGRLRWSHAVQGRHETKLGGVGPRSTPTIHEGKVYALGATGVLRCLNGTDGSLVWQHNILDDFGITAKDDEKNVGWGRASSPLIIDDLVVIPYGGPPSGPFKSLAAFDKISGDIRWTQGDRQVAFASPQLATIAGRRQILLVSQDYVGGYDAETGEPLWEHPWPGNSTTDANNSQAVPIDDDRVLVSKGYGGGALMLKIAESGGKFSTDVAWREPANLKTKFTNVAIRDGFIYGLSDGILECVDLETGERVWKKAKGRYGHGQILLVGDLLLVQTETGEVAMVEATPDDFRELGSFPALNGKTWTNLSLYGPYLLVRNAEEAACYELPLAE